MNALFHLEVDKFLLVTLFSCFRRILAWFLGAFLSLILIVEAVVSYKAHHPFEDGCFRNSCIRVHLNKILFRIIACCLIHIFVFVIQCQRPIRKYHYESGRELWLGIRSEPLDQLHRLFLLEFEVVSLNVHFASKNWIEVVNLTILGTHCKSYFFVKERVHLKWLLV